MEEKEKPKALGVPKSVEKKLLSKGFTLETYQLIRDHVSAGRAINSNSQLATVIVVQYSEEEEIEEQKYEFEKYQQQAKLLGTLSHKNMLACLHSERFSTYCLFIFEYVDKLTNSSSILSQEDIVSQILEVVAFINEKKYSVSFVQLTDLCITLNGTVKLASAMLSQAYNISTILNQTALSSFLPYPPEILSCKDPGKSFAHDKKMDAWFVGVYLYTLFGGSESTIMEMARKEKVYQILDKTSTEINKLLYVLLNPDVSARLTVTDALQNAWRAQSFNAEQEQKFNELLKVFKVSQALQAGMEAQSVDVLRDSGQEQHIVTLLSSFDAAAKKLDSCKQDGQQQVATLALGVSGAGKTTICAMLGGYTLKARCSQATGITSLEYSDPSKVQGKEIAKSSVASETRVPNDFKLDQNEYLWDCPGFNDTDPQQDMLNSFYINYATIHVNELKFLLVLDCSAWASSGGEGKHNQQKIVFETLQVMAKGKNIDFQKCMLVVFSRSPPDRQIGQLKSNLSSIIDELLKTDSYIKMLRRFFSQDEISVFMNQIKQAPCFQIKRQDKDVFDQQAIVSEMRQNLQNLVPYRGKLNLALSVKSLQHIQEIFKASKKTLLNSFQKVCTLLEQLLENDNALREQILNTAKTYLENLHDSQVTKEQSKFLDASLIFENSFVNPLLQISTCADKQSIEQGIRKELNVIQYLSDIVLGKMLISLSYNQEEKRSLQAIILIHCFKQYDFTINFTGDSSLTVDIVGKLDALAEERRKKIEEEAKQAKNCLVHAFETNHQETMSRALEAGTAGVIVGGGLGLVGGIVGGVLLGPVGVAALGITGAITGFRWGWNKILNRN